ncbi:hypothetical protein [Actinomadura sp. 9N215]|uniref:hypothetical protein n=1 Tax=Actinomadura sp. 9N215 TaxID=3375150 RepID=UPI0037A94FF5
MDDTSHDTNTNADTGVDADTDEAALALRAAGLSLSDDEIARLAAGYRTLRAKADALSALDLRDDPPIDPVAMAQTSALPGEGERP